MGGGGRTSGGDRVALTLRVGSCSPPSATFALESEVAVRMRCLSALGVSLLVLASCQKAADTKPAGAPAEKDTGGMKGMDHSTMKDAEKEYDIKGTVVDVASDKKAVTLDHEEIPGLMKAMKMKYPVSDPKVLDGIAAGDKVSGRLKARGTDYTITKLEKR